jgi:hypothetical protein
MKYAVALIAVGHALYAVPAAAQVIVSAPEVVTTYYAPAVPVTTYYAPAPVTTYYAPAPVTTYYYPAYAPTYYAPAVTAYYPSYYVSPRAARRWYRAGYYW